MKIKSCCNYSQYNWICREREDISGAKICEIVEEAGMEVTFKRFCRMTERHLQSDGGDRG